MSPRPSPVRKISEVAPSTEPEEPLPAYRLPVVAAAFAAGVLCTTRPVRELLCGVLRAAVVLAKPALVVGGLLKLRELAERPASFPPPRNSQPNRPRS